MTKAAVWFTLWAVLSVTMVSSKPLCLSAGKDSSSSVESKESSESNSSEQINAGVTLPSATNKPDTPKPNLLDTTLLPSAGPTPPSVTFAPSTLPHLEDPQTSTDIDAIEIMPDGVSQTGLAVDIPKHMPESDLGKDFLDVDTMHVIPDREDFLHPVETDLGIKQTNQNPPPTPKSFPTPQGPVVHLATLGPPPLRGDNK